MMKTITSSCSKAFINKNNDVGFSCFKDLSLDRARVCLIPSKDVARIKFLHLLSLQQHRRLQSVLSSPDSQVDLDTTETQSEQEIPSRTVNVKFKLQKECSFGDHFFIVGDHFMLGSWDPEYAIPLTWSEGHVWEVELDIPVGTSIQFKFILKTSTGALLWQPDPDRVFESCKTENTVVVCEDWEDAEHQKVIEEEPIIADQDGPRLGEEQLQALSDESGTGNGEPTLEKPLAIVAENISHPTEDLVANADNGVVGSKRSNCPDDETLDILNKNVMVAEDIGGTDKVATGDFEANLVAHEGNSPVRVPGLSPLATVSTEEAMLSEDEKHDASEEAMLSVDEKHGASEEAMLSEDEKHGATEEAMLSVDEKHGSTEEAMLSEDEKHSATEQAMLSVDEKRGASEETMLSVDEKHGATEETILSVNENNSATDASMLSVDEKHGATEETILSVDENNSATDASIGVNEASNDKLSELEEKQETEDEPWEEETAAVAKAEEEQLNQDIQEPQLAKEEQPDIQEPQLAKEEQPDIQDPQLAKEEQPDIQEPQLAKEEQPDIQEPQLAKEEQPDIQEPQLAKEEQPDIQEPQLAKEEQPDLESPQSNVLQSDVQWGRKTLQKLLDSLRFP